MMYEASSFRWRWALALALVLCSTTLVANDKWSSLTIDNDLFVGNDSGYSNGFFYSSYEVNGGAGSIPKPGPMLKSLEWSLPDGRPTGAVNAYTVGQVMNTPQDITLESPGSNQLPYSALLFVNNTFVYIAPDIADQIGFAFGVVGPLALGEPAQKFVHRITGSDEPKGWDTQLDNELVFQLSRGRIWRNWSSASDNADFLTRAVLSLGTIDSTLQSGVMVRVGHDLKSSYASSLLSSSRTSNPLAIGNSWYVYAGVNFGYVFNQIFADGNTFRNSSSIDYDNERLGLTLGAAYSRKNFSVTFAVNDSNIIQSGDQAGSLEDLTRYGTLTFAWRR